MPLYQYDCVTCPNTKDEIYPIVDKPSTIKCDKCSGLMHAVITKISLNKTSMDGNFTPYFDGQLNKFFQSSDEKSKFMKDNDYVQVDGPKSPEKTKQGNPHCTKGQAEEGLKKGLI